MSKKKNKKKSKKSKSQKQLKKETKKQDKKRLAKKKSDKKKSDKKSKKEKKSSKETSDTIQPAATFAVGDSTTALAANKEIQPMQATQSSGNGNYGSNYAVFEWDGSQWRLVENSCDYGCLPQAPTQPGSYEGERTATACQAQV